MNVVAQEECPDFWEDFSRSHSDLLFHRAVWGDVLRQGYGWRPLYVWLEENGKPILGFLGGIYNVGFMRMLYASLPYGGLVGDSSRVADLVGLLGDALRDERIHQVRLAEWGVRPELESLGFEAVELSAHRVNLAAYDEETYFKALPHSVRKNVKRSRREGLEISELADRDEVVRVFELYANSMARNGAALKYSIDRFYAIFDVLRPLGLGTILVARHGDTIVSANALVRSDEIVHDVQLSHDHAYQHMRPTDAVMFGSIQWAMAQGCHTFDFMASPKGDDNLGRFKAKWLADDIPAATYIVTYSPLRARLWNLALWASGTRLGVWAVGVLRRVR